MTKYDRTHGLVANCCYRKVTWGADSYVRHFAGSDESDHGWHCTLKYYEL
jgi:hypothetical protein